MSYGFYGFRPYVSVGERQWQAKSILTKMKKSGQNVFPVEVVGRKITTTFWGNAWCENLEAYSDFENRLPRGRTYVRNGSVIHLEIEPGKIRSLVSGTEVYEIDIAITSLASKRWKQIKSQCAGHIGSLVELLQGEISKGVMEIVTKKGVGLFPTPKEISLNCSCPDWATMCKHVAATLYGVGARLDHKPELLFRLRGVEASEMVETVINQPVKAKKQKSTRLLQADDLSSVFGVEISTSKESNPQSKSKARQLKKSTSKKPHQSKKKKTQKKARKQSFK